MKNVIFTDEEESFEINMHVSLNENIVSIKKRLSNETNIDAKNMKLYYKERDEIILIDNNSLFDGKTDKIYYLEEENDDVIIKVKRNRFNIPKYIQIHGTENIESLKRILYQYSRKEMMVFNERGVQLVNMKNISDYCLDDNFVVKVWKSGNFSINLNICNPLEKNIKQNLMKFCITDSICDVKRRIEENLNKGKNLLLYLFTESSHLQDHKQLMDYQVDDECVVFYVDLVRKEALSMEPNPFKKGNHGKQFKGTFQLTVNVNVNESAPEEYKEELFILSYPKKSNDLQFNKMLKYEIVTRLKLSKDNVTKDGKIDVDRFVPLRAIFEKDNEVYIASVFMKQGSLRNILTKNGPLSEENTIRYSIQILEGLVWMHKNNILHRNINCSSVLLDDCNNVKLCNFRLSKFLYDTTTEQCLDGIPGSKIETDKCWVAPEVMSCEPYGVKADIWSVGATMIEMMTADRPYANLNMVTATQRIVDNKTIEYSRRIYPNLNGVIDQFIHSCQWERPTALNAIQLLKAL